MEGFSTYLSLEESQSQRFSLKLNVLRLSLSIGAYGLWVGIMFN